MLLVYSFSFPYCWLCHQNILFLSDLFLFVQGRPILYTITAWILNIYIYIYIIINFVYLLLHEEIWLHIIHYFKKLHISNQGCKDRFILGFITFRDPAWNTTQKNSHKWSHLIRYGWCDEFISFVTYIICWYKSFSHSWWQLHVRTSKKQKFF